MKHRLIATTAIALFTASAATAQNVATPTTMGETWDQETINAFFQVDDTFTLLPEEDIQTNWADLPAAEQAKVRSDCAALDVAADTDGAMDSNGPATGEPATDTDAADATSEDTAEDSEATTEESDTTDEEMPTTADGGIFGNIPAGADADSEAAGADETDEESDTGVSDAGADDEMDEAADTAESADMAPALDVAQNDWEELCRIIQELDE